MSHYRKTRMLPEVASAPAVCSIEPASLTIQVRSRSSMTSDLWPRTVNHLLTYISLAYFYTTRVEARGSWFSVTDWLCNTLQHAFLVHQLQPEELPRQHLPLWSLYSLANVVCCRCELPALEPVAWGRLGEFRRFYMMFVHRESRRTNQPYSCPYFRHILTDVRMFSLVHYARHVLHVVGALMITCRTLLYLVARHTSLTSCSTKNPQSQRAHLSL